MTDQEKTVQLIDKLLEKKRFVTEKEANKIDQEILWLIIKARDETR